MLINILFLTTYYVVISDKKQVFHMLEFELQEHKKAHLSYLDTHLLCDTV